MKTPPGSVTVAQVDRGMTPETAALIASYLEIQFPWLLDPHADVSGADVIQDLSSVHEVLQAIGPPKAASRFREYRSFCPCCSQKSVLPADPRCPECGTRLVAIDQHLRVPRKRTKQ